MDVYNERELELDASDVELEYAVRLISPGNEKPKSQPTKASP